MHKKLSDQLNFDQLPINFRAEFRSSEDISADHGLPVTIIDHPLRQPAVSYGRHSACWFSAKLSHKFRETLTR
jgi:hypothetical protein